MAHGDAKCKGEHCPVLLTQTIVDGGVSVMKKFADDICPFDPDMESLWHVYMGIVDYWSFI